MGAECFKSAVEDTDPTSPERRAKAKKSGSISEPTDQRKPYAALFSYQRAKCRSHAIIEASKNPEDYVVENLGPGSTWVRLPGQINDQRINIADCCQSTIVLADQCDSVQIDDCKTCVFFIGPTMGSVFLRGLSDCSVVVLCGQLRLRDCKNVRLGLMCKTRPVIESCSSILIGPYAGPSYFDLAFQLAAAQMSTLNNRWSAVHDFTPGANRTDNFSFLSRADTADLIPPLAAATNGQLMSADEEAAMSAGVSIVAVPLGATCATAGVPLGVCGFGPDNFDAAEQLALRMSDAGVLVYSEERRFTPESFQPIAVTHPKLCAEFISGVCVIISFMAGRDNVCDFGAKTDADFAVFGSDAARLSRVIFVDQANGDGFGHKHQ